MRFYAVLKALMFRFYISIVLQTRNGDSFVLTFKNPHPNDAVFIITTKSIDLNSLSSATSQMILQ